MAGACLVFGDDNIQGPARGLPGKIVRCRRFPAVTDELRGRLLQELARQSFLVAARDQLGLRTRDVSLGDEMPGGGDDAPFEVLAQFKSQSRLERPAGVRVPRQDAVGRGTAGGHEVRTNRKRQVRHVDRLPGRADGNGEALPRRVCRRRSRRAGFQGKPNALKNSADVPQKIEKSLEKMDFVSQFSAVRALHELIRADGESPERLGALVRGYANLGLLTEFHWHPAHKAFKARALVYAQRMVFRDKQPWRATWHRAYAFALAGLHQLALDDLQTAAKQWRPTGKDGGQRPAWVGLIDAYCRFDHAKLKTAGEEGPGKKPRPAAVVRQRRAFRSQGDDHRSGPEDAPASFRTAIPPWTPSASTAA